MELELKTDFHPQASVWIEKKGGTDDPGEYESFFVDEKLAGLIELIHGLGLTTYGSCQNYGEYLRSLGFDHVFESGRDYAYVEFYTLEDAFYFTEAVKGKAGVGNPLHHQIALESTPNAWELKYRVGGLNHFWVWFPEDDISAVEEVLSYHA